MDLLSHAVLGAAIGEAMAGRRAGRRAMAVGAAAALLPDLDVLGHFFHSDAEQLVFHRGITHSLLITALAPPLIAWLLTRFRGFQTMPWLSWAALLWVGMASHLALDVCTCYGTGLLEPFSHARFSLDSIFVADPLYTLPLLIGWIAVMLSKQHPVRRMRWNWAGIILSSLYLLWAQWNHAHVHQKMEASLTIQHPGHGELTVTPTPLNNVLWMGFAPDAEGYWMGFCSLLDSDDPIDFQWIPQQDSLLDRIPPHPEVGLLREFTMGHYVLTAEGDDVYLNDLRFGYADRWDAPGTVFALRYNLSPGADNSHPLDRMRFRESSWTILGRIWQRTCGK